MSSLPPPKKRVSFKTVALSLAGCAILVAILNLYMNIMATYSIPSLQLDLSADGDVIGFHQFDLVSPAEPETVYQQRKGQRLSQFALRAGINPKHLAHFKDVPPDADEKPAGSNLSQSFIPYLRSAVQVVTDAPKRVCQGLCAPSGSLQTQPNYVKSLIEARMKLVPRNTFSVEIGSKTGTLRKPPTLLDFIDTWHKVSLWTRNRTIVQENFEKLVDPNVLLPVIDAVTSAKILAASVPAKGTQLKASLLLQGKQRAIWKPQRYGRNDSIPSDTPYAGADRHNGEIAAFHLAGLLGLNRVPIAIGRKLNLKEQLYDVADTALKATFFNDSKKSSLCFYGKCLYCKPQEAACANSQSGQLEGTMILWLPPPYDDLSRIRSPWARTYDSKRTAPWETDPNFCASVQKHDFFGSSPIFLDLIDMAIFDWLIGNADRHRLEYFASSSIKSKTILLLDNGKSLGNSELDEITILAPLYQCCNIRTKLYHRLIKYSEENFGSILNERLRIDPLYPILSSFHLEAINRRIRKVLVVLAACIEIHGESYVLKDDGY